MKNILLMALFGSALSPLAAHSESAKHVATAPSSVLSVPTATMRQYISDVGSYWQIEAPATLGSDVASFNWAQMAALLKNSGLALKAENSSLKALQKRGVPALLRLQGPEEWVLGETFGAAQTLIYRNGRDELIENKILAARYRGEAIVYAPLTPLRNNAPQLRWENPVRIAPVTEIGGDSEIVQNVFVTNAGRAPLEWKVASTSCGCTGAETIPATILPGARGLLKIRMHARDSRLVTVNLKSNDPLRPNLIVAVQSQAPDVVIAAPSPLFIGAQIDEGAEVQSTVRLPPSARVTSVEASLPFLKPVLQKQDTIGKAGSQSLRVQLLPSAPAGRFAGSVALRLADSPIQKITVPVSGFVSDDIVVEPSLVQLGEVAVGATVTRSVKLKAPKNKTFLITKATSRNPKVTATIDSMGEAATHSVEIKVPVESANATLQERITLFFDDGRTLDVDIFGTIKPTG